MCGIAGIYRRGAGPIAEARLRAMQQDLVHRGPDDCGLKSGEHLGLATTRLAILDLSASANQPMLNDDQTLWMAFNGEAVSACIRRHMAGENHGEKLWALLCLELWFRMFIDRDIGKGDRLRDLG